MFLKFFKKTSRKIVQCIKQKKRITRRPFTLLEIFICLAIITIVSGIWGIKIYESVQKSQFEAQVTKLHMHMQYCRKMALSHQADVYLELTQTPKGILCEMGTEEMQGFFQGRKKETDSLKDIFFEYNGESKEKLLFGFSSTGKIFPEGVIQIHHAKGYKKIWHTEELFGVKNEEEKILHPDAI